MNSTIQTIGYPRAALIGNPSDGFHGETVAFTFSNFSARATLSPSHKIILEPHNVSPIIFSSIDHLIAEAQNHGYSPSVALIQATIKKFCEHCSEITSLDSQKGFHLHIKSDIPYQVGIAGLLRYRLKQKN